MTTGTNVFDDIFFVAYRENGEKVVRLYEGTTDPGFYYLQQPLNASGCFIMQEGQHRGVYKLGPHGKSKYLALRQCKAIPGYRDGNFDTVHDMDPETIQNDIFWTNYHHGYNKPTVNYNSAGCQVLRYVIDLEEVLRLCKRSERLYGETFTYTLLNREDISLILD